MDQNTPEAWYRNLPIITKVVATATLIVTVLTVLEFLDPRAILLDWTLVAKRCQIWRLFFDYLFVGKFSFSWLFQMYFFVNFSSRLEQNEIFSASTAGSYLYFILIQVLALDLISLIFYFPSGKMMMGPSLHFAIIYYWSRREPWAPVGLWGFTLSAYQLPFALLIMDVLMGGSVWGDLMGLFTGHLHYFVREILPEKHQMDPLAKCPKFLDEAVVNMANFSLSSVFRGATGVPFPGGAGQSGQQPPTGSGSRAPATIASMGAAGSGGSSSSRDAGNVQEFSGRGFRLGGD